MKRCLFHATYQEHLDSILKFGLGAIVTKKAWEFSKEGVVCLSEDEEEAISYAETSEEVPEEWLDEIILLRIDTSELDLNLFHPDENTESETCYEYHGIIPESLITVERTYC